MSYFNVFLICEICAWVQLVGADLVGVNCNFGPKIALETMKLMKAALDKAELKTYMMMQPVCFFTPEIKSGNGLLDLPGHFLGNA